MDIKVTKSDLDPKNYKVFKLENGLKVLLVYESTFDSPEGSSELGNKKKRSRACSNAKKRSKRDNQYHNDHFGSSSVLENNKIFRELKKAKLNQFNFERRYFKTKSCDKENKLEKETKKEKDEDYKRGCDDKYGGDDDGGNYGNDSNNLDCDRDMEEEDEKEKKESDFCGNIQEEDMGFISAASLCVGVGSLSDPKSIPGLAHYLEHMVFMGSEKYPATNDFDLFIKGHGGNTNAHTDYERTHFHFEIQSRVFCEALHRFAQFFICPLLNNKALIAEAKVVHSEWEMNIQKERSRFEQLMLSMSKPDNPFNNFMWGNYKTLVEEPKKRKIDINHALQCFRKKFYVAQNMTLCIYTDSKIETVENFIRSIFNKIPSSNDKLVDFSEYGDPFDTPEFRKIYKVVPVQNTYQLEITWTFPSMTKFYRSRPLHYLERFIGDKGVGSLFSQLHSRQWIHALSCGNNGGGMDWNSCISLFRVVFYLTEEGFHNSFEIITILYQYLKMLKAVGPLEGKWKEMYQIEINEFIYSEPTDYQDFVDLICTSMFEFQPEDYVISNYVVSEYNPELITRCLEYMTPERMNVVMRGQCFKNTANKVEKWFKSLYSVEEIPNAWMKKWKHPPNICNNSMHIPADNHYIATDFSLRAVEKQYEQMNDPLINTELGRVWYKSDLEFRIPKAYIFIYFWSQYMNRTATESCLSDMFVNYVRRVILEETYPADLAYFYHYIGLFNNGLLLKLGGFNHKLRLLFELYIDKMGSINIEEMDFSMTKLQMIDIYTNNLLCPELLNSQMATSHLLPQSWTYLEKLQCIKTIDRPTLCTYVSNIFKGVYFEILAQGNVSSKETLSLTSYMVDHLDTIPLNSRIKINVMEIHPGSTIMISSNKNSHDNNSVITNYYQFGPACLIDHLLNEMIFLLMEEPCFEELRTGKQLGYNVFPHALTIYGIVGFNITVCSQAKDFTMEKLDDAIDEFLTNFHDRIMSMNEEDFQSTKNMMSNSRGIDGSLVGQVERCWEEIISHDYLFDRSLIESKKIEGLALVDLKDFCRTLIPRDRKHRRKLTVQVIGNTENESDH